MLYSPTFLQTGWCGIGESNVKAPTNRTGDAGCFYLCRSLQKGSKLAGGDNHQQQ
jgi:hypothetical protein